jgi:hypothetical protein
VYISRISIPSAPDLCSIDFYVAQEIAFSGDLIFFRNSGKMTLARDYVLASYTLSKSMDTGSTEVGLGSNTAGYTQVLAESVAELRVPPLAPSDFDARHTFSTALSGETGKSGNTTDILLRNWGFDEILRGNSARPLNVLYQRLLGPNASYYNVTHDVVPNQPF